MQLKNSSCFVATLFAFLGCFGCAGKHAADHDSPTVAARAPAVLRTGKLILTEQPGILTIAYGGSSRIPSWKVVLLQDDGGNLSAIHVPASNPAPLSSRDDQWPLGVMSTGNSDGAEGTMTKGRENFAKFKVRTFEVQSRSDDKVVVHVAGPSKNSHYDHDRLYTFTPAGVAVEGTVTSIVQLSYISIATHWARDQLADSVLPALPIRKQGRGGWIYMASTGRDGPAPLVSPAGYPLEIELTLRQPTSTTVRLFFDKNFEIAGDKETLVHNNKDSVKPKVQEMAYEKVVTMSAAGPMPKGTKQTYGFRFTFEAR
jgi:hypothetical protein